MFSDGFMLGIGIVVATLGLLVLMWREIRHDRAQRTERMIWRRLGLEE